MCKLVFLFSCSEFHFVSLLQRMDGSVFTDEATKSFSLSFYFHGKFCSSSNNLKQEEANKLSPQRNEMKLMRSVYEKTLSSNRLYSMPGKICFYLHFRHIFFWFYFRLRIKNGTDKVLYTYIKLMERKSSPQKWWFRWSTIDSYWWYVDTLFFIATNWCKDCDRKWKIRSWVCQCENGENIHFELCLDDFI